MEIERLSVPMTPDDDALLVGFIDNALDEAERNRLLARLADDAELRARLKQIEAGALPLAPAFAALLEEAPLDRLRASLAASEAQDPPSASTARAVRPTMRALVAGAAIALFLVGFAVGRLTPPWASTEEAEQGHDDWRQAVAQYMALYTPDTFASAASDPAAQTADLAALGGKLGAALTPERIAVPDLPFKRAEILTYDRAPLGQLAYLDPRSGPVLFCIIADSRPDAPISGATVGGFATASWAHGGRGFMVIGRLPSQRIAQIAGELAPRF
jgi:anti-sigma factor RsiW